ncbi:M56 family metallopeptidase [Spirosoma koreense]
METLRYVLAGNGLLAVVSVAYYVLLRRETFLGANRLALWLGLLGALVVPLLKLPDWRPQPVRAVMQRTAQVIIPRVLPRLQNPEPEILIVSPNQKTHATFQIQPRPFVWSWQSGLITLYLAGLFVLSVRFISQLVSLKKLVDRSVHEPYDEFTLVWNEGISSPFSFFGWVVMNPTQHTPDELEQILRHERVHVRELHSLDMIGTELLCIIFWFNPAAYLFRYLLQQTLEFRADQVVLAEGVDVKTYQYHLLKVSLSASKAVLTNHFSKSQLKSRIAMINRPNSSTFAWLKYPVFFAIAFTVATAFARPQPIKELHSYVSNPIAETLAAIAEPKTKPAQPTKETAPKTGSVESGVGKLRTQKLPVQPRRVDTAGQWTHADTAYMSPSRYMQYEGDKLYWIITPKTSFDDLAIIKREFERHGYRMQVQTLKYDPQKAYITDIRIKIIRPVVGVSDFEETGVNGGPIRSHGGYNGLNTLNTVAAVGSYPFNNDFLHIPQGLVAMARDEELSTARSTVNKKIEDLIAEGQRTYGHLGIGLRRFSPKEIIEQTEPRSFVRVDPNGYLSVDNAVNLANVFINNKPATSEDIRRIKIDRLYTLAVLYGYASAKQQERKQAGTRYLLFYINEDN